MITTSMKRIVLSIIESAREVSDSWKANSTNRTMRSKAEFIKAMDRLEQAVNRLDRMQDAKEKTYR
jgi:CTP synthase (UTP-ammonia lyase)